MKSAHANFSFLHIADN